ncbi:polyamine-transporting ATPase 13A2-like isoform X1 [Homarus americanus]|uniref:polyamine-transporting ATPase 13A2-like isoform X1 n=1 Tax=Homarus americanus TaxID=6706 RepID=UPI001C44C65E|nr:polyamine-transporting ATPase 13A2-like isoform X1 [Homarus americanus]XP_042227488.1 polyamine-transporting ATPase 13A2-like isoform X1 [Homarus americanus]XP_042227489.1 polyamine-transporting ATPase 13A2-like isoform X1 [Homarus americanus]
MWGTKAAADRLNLGTKDELEATGYTKDPVKLALTVVATVLTGGLLLILITWRPSIKLALTHRCCSLLHAQKLLLKDIYHQLWEEEVVREASEGQETCVYFVNKKIKYVWDDATCTFIMLKPLDHRATFKTFHQVSAGLDGDTARRRRSLFGENFMKIEVLSVRQLLIQQAYNPFYIFQAYTVILWILQAYYLFSGCITALSIISITLIVWETRRQSRALRETVTSQSDITVLRDGERKVLSSREVVPGDVVLIEDNMGKLEVDAVLLQGTIVTNEAMLTGESIPVTKVGVPLESDVMFCENEHRHHLLHSGTQVVQVRGAKELPALVINTGFSTVRGELVRSILFPKPMDFHFYNDFLKLLLIFLVLGVAAMSWSFQKWIKAGASWHEILFNSLDIITFVVPPILPATITAINVWAQQRLKKQDIFSLSSNYIPFAGSIDIICFDKTGTLTEDDLALAGVVPSVKGDLAAPLEDLAHLSPDQPLTKALATCHSLTLINGRLIGYPLDVKIFTGIDWVLEEPDAVVNSDYGIVTQLLVQPRAKEGVDPNVHQMAILKTFPFESREQRMTVVTRSRTSTALEIFIKGAPEKVASLCRPDTVPGIMEAALEWYTRQGLRVLAVAGKTLREGLTLGQVEVCPREELEDESAFLGLVLLHNKLKVETAPVLAILHKARLATVMVTGDNLLTALSVARQSGMVQAGIQLIVVKAVVEAASAKAAQHLKVFYYDADSVGRLHNQQKMISVRNDNYALATDGKTFDLIANSQDKNLFHRLLHKGRVFARMKPEQKVTVVETLQNLGRYVAMCGDGCNDCGALKVADTGISLSSAEASVAAPFTSRKENITCVPTLIREGRSALVSIFTAFKYNVVSCLGALICVLFHFSINTEPTDLQYLIQDLVLMTIPALVMGNTGPPSYLTPSPPSRRILSFLPSASIFSFLGLQALAYWTILAYLRAQSWFEPFKYEEYRQLAIPSYENTSLITMSFYSVIIGAFVFSHSAPYRKPIYTNYILIVYLLVATSFSIFITFCREAWLINFFNFRRYPEAGFCGVLFFAACINCIVCFMWERWLLYGVMQQYVLPWFQSICGPHPLYTKLEAEMKANQEWPPLTEPHQSRIQGYSSEGEPMVEKEELDIGDEQYGDDTMLMRKLTRRHQFQATVKYLPEKSHINSNTKMAAGNTTINMSSIDDQQWTQHENEPLIDHHSLSPLYSPPESMEYQEPWDALQGGGPSFKSNHSVRHQIMKGTSGAFKTFKGSVKRQNAVEDSAAHPYEVINLCDTRTDKEEIYATISEDLSQNHEQTWTPPLVHTNSSQEQEELQASTDEKNEVGLQEETEWGRGETDNLEEMGLGRIEWCIKNPDGEDDDNTSLMEHMDIAWQRMSGYHLQPSFTNWKTDLSGTSTSSRPVSIVKGTCLQEQIYDVPKPPRPVGEPYSPAAPTGTISNELPELPLHLPSDATVEWKNEESTC